jgi:hypothetical protein
VTQATALSSSASIWQAAGQVVQQQHAAVAAAFAARCRPVGVSDDYVELQFLDVKVSRV